MYARSTTIRGNPQALDAGIAHIRDEVMPLVEGLDGFVGLSMLCDRGSGRCIVTAAWADEAALHASAERVRDSRARAAEVFGDPAPAVREWEVAAMHRVRDTHYGACVRVLWCAGEPGTFDRVMEAWRSTIPQQLEELEGFCSASVLVDPGSAQAVAAIAYDSREAMNHSRELAAALRERFSTDLRFQITDVAEFDLLLAHLRVPEMA